LLSSKGRDVLREERGRKGVGKGKKGREREGRKGDEICQTNVLISGQGRPKLVASCSIGLPGYHPTMCSSGIPVCLQALSLYNA